MPIIEQLDWSKLQPETKDRIAYRKEKPTGYLKFEPGTKGTKPKKTAKPKKNKQKKLKKIKATDKTIWTDNFKYTEHLYSIMNE